MALSSAGRVAARRLLVPAPGATTAAGATVVEQAMTSGLPHRVTLTPSLALLVVLPTGLATAWRDAPADALVSTGSTGTGPAPAPLLDTVGDALTPPLPPGPPSAAPRLVILRGGRVAGAVPLIAGTCVVLPEADPVPGERVEVVVRSWVIRAGALRGPGDSGSRIVLAWRRVDPGSPTWAPPRPPLLTPTGPDDLERLEGVGPVLAAALRAAGITTFAQVAASSAATLRAAIGRAGWSFAPSITTWAEQAELLATGDVAGFEALVSRLVAGRQP